ncbi:MAG: methyltransferase domain-containing protein [Pseudomonadota bacterium]|nr:methyltransferase domain-containing protein [Pseudomonadota bacterium]
MSAQSESPAIAAQRDAYRSVYDTGLAKLLSAIWGGNLHLGLFEHPEQPLAAAQVRVKNHMARAAALGAGERVIEAACGVGTTARHLVTEYGVSVLATNISEAQLEEARQTTDKEGLSERITFRFSDFHALDIPDRSFDCWWCQEALLYAVDKRRVLEEARRAVRRGGRIVFTDLLITHSMPEAERQAFAIDMKTPEMWAIEDWDRVLREMEFDRLERRDWREHTVWTFVNVANALAEVRDEFVDLIGREAVEGTEYRIRLQLEKARAGKLGWCFFALAV